MNADETLKAAQTMLDSLKPGAVVECGHKPDDKWEAVTPYRWNWGLSEYRVRFPDEHRSCEGCVNQCLFESRGVRQPVIPGECRQCHHWDMPTDLRTNWTAPAPDPKYRAWRTVEEVPIGAILQRKSKTGRRVITGAEKVLDSLSIFLAGWSYGENVVFDDWTMADGTPCGVKIEEPEQERDEG